MPASGHGHRDQVLPAERWSGGFFDIPLHCWIGDLCGTFSDASANPASAYGLVLVVRGRKPLRSGAYHSISLTPLTNPSTLVDDDRPAWLTQLA
jgi:hypothetical protein